MNEISLANKIAAFSLVTFLIISIFFWIKLFFEINKLAKLGKLSTDITFFNAPFFLTQLLKLKNLALKNNKYLPVFVHFYYQHQNFFCKNNLLFLEKFLQKFSNPPNWNEFLVETEASSNFFQAFQQFQNQVNDFSLDLRSFSALEQTILEKVNFFRLILDKSEEDLKTLKMKLNFNSTEVENIFTLLNDKNQILQKSIHSYDHQNILELLLKVENKIITFSNKFFNWLKLINLFLIVLTQKQKDLIDGFSIVKQTQKHNDAIVKLLNRHEQSRVKIELLLDAFDVEGAKSSLLQLITSIENEHFQLNKLLTMQKVFRNSFDFIVNHFRTIKRTFVDFEQISQTFNKDLFYFQFENSGFGNAPFLIKEIDAKINTLFIKISDHDPIYFFQPLLVEVKTILSKCLDLIDIRYQMELFFNQEKEKHEMIFLTLSNLCTLLEKKHNFALKVLFDEKVKKLMNNFLSLEHKRLNFNLDKANKDYNLLFDAFRIQVFDLKSNLKNIFFLKIIAELLFVKVNKMRFSNELYHNKILNCEILFLKQQYKNVIELLVEIIRQDLVV